MTARSGVMVFMLGLVCAACGPRISELRIIPTPPREETCQLEFVKLDMMDLSSENGTWQVIGNIILGDNGTPDPFSEKLKAIVRPRACRMGGEGVTLMMSATNETLLADGTRINYGVLKRRSSTVEPPKTF